MMKKASIATFSTNQKHSSKYGVRSISLPTRSHPCTIQIEEELIKLKSWETSSSSTSKVETICFGLSGLTELYKCIEHLLKLPLTQQALSQHKNEKWVDELLDFPLRFLDLLSKTRDDVLFMKGKVEDLQSVLRRRKIGDMENHVAEYWSLRRKMRKECTKSLLLLKQIDGSIGSSFFSLDLNNHLCSIVKVLIEASLITSSILQSLVVFLSSPVLRSKVNKWSLVSRLMQKGVFGCDNQNENINELEKVDYGVSSLMIMENLNKDAEADEKIQSAHGRLEALVVAIEGIENGLECLFKRLINTRVSFLNIISP